MDDRNASASSTEHGLVRALLVLLIIALSVVLAIGTVRLLGDTSAACVVILAAIVVAYILLPAVKLLERYMPMAAALGLTFLGFFALIAIAIWVLIPPLFAQAQQLATSLPNLVAQMQSELSNRDSRLLSSFPPNVQSWLQTLPGQFGLLISKYAFTIAQRTFTILTSAVSVFLSVIIVPILTIYLFVDHVEMKRAVLGFVPAGWRPHAVAILSDLNDVLGSFVRGQLLDGAIVGALIWLLLVIAHVPYALLIGVLAGILNFIPYVGAIIGFFPSVLLAFVYNGWQDALLVAVGFGVIQQVDGNLIVPRIMKAQVQLSPALLIVSILLFSTLFGVVGTFIAVPVTAMLRVFKLHFFPAPSVAQAQRIQAASAGLTKLDETEPTKKAPARKR
jgi:predicted PurR-regulated permease PerM